MDGMGGFPQKLKKLRKSHKMSQRVLSELCGLSKNMIGQYERGEKTPSMKSIVALADFFGVSVDSLVGRKNF